jgi:hypothetical protein
MIWKGIVEAIKIQNLTADFKVSNLFHLRELQKRKIGVKACCFIAGKLQNSKNHFLMEICKVVQL